MQQWTSSAFLCDISAVITADYVWINGRTTKISAKKIKRRFEISKLSDNTSLSERRIAGTERDGIVYIPLVRGGDE